MTSASQLPLHIDPQSNLPIFAQLRQQITWLIASGDLKPDDRLPTIRELADQLSVNMHTIRQAYHSLEDDGLVETRPSRGTRVKSFDLNKLFTTESASPSHTIGILVPNMYSFYDPFLDGVEEIARHSGYMIIVCFTRDNEELTRQTAQQLVAKNVDGIVAASPVAGVFERHLPTPSDGPPIVYVDAPQFPTHTILLDLENAGFLAAEHLIKHGHRRIGMITAPLTWPNFYDSYKGYTRALHASNLDLDPALVIETPAFSLENGYQAALRLLELKKPPKAVFISGDLMAAGVIRALKENGRRIPEDFAIVSKDNIELAALMDPALTTVTLPAYQMGVEATNMLVRLITGKRLNKKRIVLRSELMVRRSCGCT
ncbi:MAG TPA: substrate-binding domain-containing protein [Anaerolineales bacterium]|nr:substrate-binding domain-containing protein [Anaerolineales bacterium]